MWACLYVIANRSGLSLMVALPPPTKGLLMPPALPATKTIAVTQPGAGKLTLNTITDPNGNQSVDPNDDGFTITGEVLLPNFLTDGAFDSKVSLMANGTVQATGASFHGIIGETKIDVVGKAGEPQNSTPYPFILDYEKAKNVPDGVYTLVVTFVFGDLTWDIHSFVDLGAWQFI
jgi:hypothetical protein